MTDKLIVIERKDWPALRDLYSPSSPSTFTGYACIDNFIRWTDQQPDIPNLTFYSLNGDWSDGTFFVINGDIIHTYTVGGTSERLRKLVQLVDFSKGLKILTVQDKDHPAINDVIKSKKLALKFYVKNLMHHLPATEALKFDVTPPEGITLKSVEQSDVHIADAVWPHHDENSLPFLQQMAQLNPCVGAYDSDGRMIAWVFCNASGPLLALQVDKEFYGRGLGMLVTKALSRKIAELGQDIDACVDDTNTHSLAIFKKLGFKITENIHWMGTMPIE